MDCSFTEVRFAIGLSMAVWLASGGAALGQQFEVASVKASRAAEGMAEAQIRAQDMMHEQMPAGLAPMKGATVVAHNRTLAQLVAMAYSVRPSSVTGPNWITELRYDVDAKLPEGAPAKDANEMLRRLLEERFGLRTHMETKATAGFALVVAKDGPKLTPAAAAPSAPLDQEEMQRRAQERMRQRMAEMNKPGGMRGSSSWGSSQATTAQIADGVSRMIKAPVVDETGLKGKYDVRVEMLAGESPDDTVEYRMSLALAKLGLKLESRKTEVNRVVVDSASKTPTEN
jgi:uncharacterized protein (TIGR03435 family)